MFKREAASTQTATFAGTQTHFVVAEMQGTVAQRKELTPMDRTNLKVSEHNTNSLSLGSSLKFNASH